MKGWKRGIPRTQKYDTQLLLDSFWQHVVEEPNTGCWIWIGMRSHNGYGRMLVWNRKTPAHRWALETFRAITIPPGYQVDHLCKNRPCVNPAHLQAVTVLENVRRSDAANKTHCPAGHEYSAQNTLIHRRGYRVCRLCNINRLRARRAKEKENG